jgi:predicted nucleic acid-binding Zn ribbon protein
MSDDDPGVDPELPLVPDLAPVQPSGRDLARAALEQVKADARLRRQETEGKRAAGRRAGARSEARRAAAERGSPGEPASLKAVLDRWLAVNGRDGELAVATVLSAWGSVVGEAVAAHSTPVSLRDGELVVEADSTAWATQLRLLEVNLLEAIAASLGEGIVSSVRVHGPAGPSWRHGRLRVPGPGPRDTYG